MAKVEIYTKVMCPYCVRAKSLLDQKGVEYEEIIAATDRDKKQEMMERSGGRATYPQIFIGEEHIGGCDDLMSLERRGKLDEKLAAS
jgi:glutaredoxin 3